MRLPIDVAAPVSSPAPARRRLESIDLVRGVVIALMALDHTRDFLGASTQNPRDVTDAALFLTRWVTHLCAPTFILLAGVSAHLYGVRGRSAWETSRFLLTRGLWLVFVEFTIVSFGWNLTVTGPFVAQVIWAIGISMLVLAGLVQLPRWAIAIIAVALVGGHDLLDAVRAESLGSAGWIWHVLHQPGRLPLSSRLDLLVIYPLLPWPGVMALGYLLGPLFRREPVARRRVLLGAGAALLAGFFVLRAVGAYGDPTPWHPQSTALATVLSFLDCEKYPPSLLYLMMTLGPALLLLALFERVEGRAARWFTTFGRVPFLFYVAHIPLIHLVAVALAFFTVGDVAWLVGTVVPPKPPGYGLPLPGVYVAWVALLLALYPVCRWFGALKARRHDWWLSYL